MKQALLRKGTVSVEDVPDPVRSPHNLLVEVTYSLISPGTEMSSVQNSAGSLWEKVRRKPEALKKAAESVRTRGLLKTLALAHEQLDESKPLGYSCVGRVLSVGESVKAFRVGDRVACAGAGLANHAEVVSVPASLCVRVPEGVADRAACFVTLGAIALQGVRRADVRLGEIVCVIGLGLIGQLTVQLLVAAGCQVVGMDLDPRRVEQALKHGMRFGANSSDDLSRTALLMTGQRGVDATILTASTSSSEPTQLAFHLTRKKGRIVVVGAVGLDLKRSPFYEREQDFLISCSYGPGRYDPVYEKDGHDYPFAYVRWTENRNMAAFLEFIEQKRVDVESLIDREVKLDEVGAAYESLASGASPRPVAIVICYPQQSTGRPRVIESPRVAVPGSQGGRIRLGLIGAGSFPRSTHIPNLEKHKEKVQIAGVCTRSGASANTMGRRLGAKLISNDYREILGSPDIDAVLVATRHHNHAEIAEAALKAGKHVYLEKPLALTLEQLESLDRTVRALSSCPVFMVGFNRRYSPFALKLAEAFAKRTTPLMINYRVNAGLLPETHWTLTDEGGGRLRGEACHMVDLFRFLVSRPMRHCDIEALPPVAGLRADDNFLARFNYDDGSICGLTYVTTGGEELRKEWAEFHWSGQSAVLDDYTNLTGFGFSGTQKLSQQDKGHAQALEMFISAMASGNSFPTPWEELYETTRATIELDQAAWGGRLGGCEEESTA